MTKVLALCAVIVIAVTICIPTEVLPTIISIDHHAILAMAVAAIPAIPRRYLRKANLLTRYGWKAKISVDRAVKAKRLPPPDTYIGSVPLWLEQTLDAHDEQRLHRHQVRS